ncbi:MAG: cyclic nucleotide-binding domain-containing protein [Candidatus Gracilibacteria bacterium]|nr:cyclic nucleotide-binding domain-containing protein [Candidatus Gracilibacteria bacterium]
MEKIKTNECINEINVFDELKNEISPNIDKKSLNKKKLSTLKNAILKHDENFILANIESYEKSPLFSKKNLKKGEKLFEEGDFDSNLYIIKSGRLSVQKYTSLDKENVKELAVLQTGDFFGEGSLKKNEEKKTNIIAIDKTELLLIEGQNGLKNYIKENPESGTELLFHIIDKTNNRLNETNAQIAINYEIDTTIRELKSIDQNTIIPIIDKIQTLINADYAIYIEKHSVVKNYFTIKYDSRIAGKFLNIGIEASSSILDLKELYKLANIDEKDFISINKISIGGDDLGFLLIGKETRSFSNNEKIIAKSIANSLAGVIKQIFLNKDEKEILSLKNAKMEY